MRPYSFLHYKIFGMVIILLIVLFFIQSCSSQGIFQNRWYDYYERGLSYADKGLWEQAEQDLKEAIHRRSDEKKLARTYGGHTISYFPHRELGIVLYKQGKTEDAIKKLDYSLSLVKSSKAELYLNRARKSLILQKGLDRLPILMIDRIDESDSSKNFSPKSEYILYTKSNSIFIHGIAEDDTFVEKISINRRDISINSDRMVTFYEEVRLNPGKNEIQIEAVNLIGKKSDPIILNVYLDTTGPVINISRYPPGNQLPENTIIFSDDFGLEEIVVNGKVISIPEGSRRFKYPDKLFIKNKELTISAKDKAGNITNAKMVFPPMYSKEGTRLLADNSSFPGEMIADIQGRASEEINLTNPQKYNKITHLDYMIVEGYVSDETGIKQIYINNEGCLKEPEKFRSYFSKKVCLNSEGKNPIMIKAEVLSQNIPLTKSLDVIRQSLAYQNPPLGITIDNFKREPNDLKQYLTDAFEESLISIINKHKRFKAARYKKDSDFTLDGYAYKRSEYTDKQLSSIIDTLEIIFEMKDIQTEESIIGDSYTEGLSNNANCPKLAIEIVEKLKSKMPLKESMVIDKKDNDQIIVRMGKESNISKGMKLMVYKIERIFDHQEILGLNFKLLGMAKITKSEERIAWASLDKNSNYNAIQIQNPDYIAITR